MTVRVDIPPPLTWLTLTAIMPKFVQWVVQRYGPLPDGRIIPDDWDRYKAEYEDQRLMRLERAFQEHTYAILGRLLTADELNKCVTRHLAAMAEVTT